MNCRTGVTASLVLILAGSLGRQDGDHGSASRAALLPQVLEVQLQAAPLRSAVYLSYRRAGLGEVRITNRSARPASGLTLSIETPDREDLLPEPFTAAVPEILPGDTAVVRVLPRFSPAILDEKTSEILLRAALFSSGRQVAEAKTLVPVIDRSLVTWDVPERIAALIDPEPLLRIVRGALAAGASSKTEDLPIPSLRSSAAAFDALSAWGLRYLEDTPPATAQALLGVPADRVNTPAETLRDHGGDCDDLSVLLAAGLEAAGVPSAMGVCESHVFVLFDSGIEDLESSAVDPSWVLQRGGRAWMPLEATCLARPGATLLSAWSAARGRLPALRSGEAKFFEVRKAWSDYPALAAPSRASSPERREIQGRPAFPSERELARVLHAEAARRAEEARKGGGEEGEGDRRAAAAFAACGFHADAQEILRRAVARKPEAGARLELAGEIIARPLRAGDLAEARGEIQAALEGLDPLDLVARSEALKRLEEVSLLLGKPREAERAAAAEAALFGDAFGSERAGGGDRASGLGPAQEPGAAGNGGRMAGAPGGEPAIGSGAADPPGAGRDLARKAPPLSPAAGPAAYPGTAVLALGPAGDWKGGL